MHQGPRGPFQSGRAKKSCQCKETLRSVFRHLSCICVDYEQSLFSLGPSSKTPEARSHAYKSERVLSAARSTYVSYRAILAKYKWNLLHLRLINTSLSFLEELQKISIMKMERPWLNQFFSDKQILTLRPCISVH